MTGLSALLLALVWAAAGRGLRDRQHASTLRDDPSSPLDVSRLLVAPTDVSGSELGLYCAVGVAFIFAGGYAWSRREGNRIGLLLVVAGVLWLLHGLRRGDNAAFFMFGSLLVAAHVPVLVHAILSFPSGRLHRPLERRLVLIAYVYWIPVHALPMTMVDLRSRYGGGVPSNLLLVGDAPTLAGLVHIGQNIGDVLLALSLVIVLINRLDEETPAARWSVRPVLYASAVTLGTTAVTSVGWLNPGWLNWSAYVLGFLALPVGFVVALERGRHARRLIQSEFRFRDAPPTWPARYLLHDPSLEIISGTDSAPRGRAVTPLVSSGRQIGAIVHDRAVLNEPELLRAVATAAAVAVETSTRLAMARRDVAELQTSRRRLVEAATHERLRIERNLHDGAQQRLVAAALLLKRGLRDLDASADVRDLIVTAASEIELANGEIRELARGLHPPALARGGLAGAVRDLAVRSATMPIDVVAPSRVDVPMPVAAAAYYTVLEGVTNAIKHSHASRVQVDITDGTELVVQVLDDGAGGAEAIAGGGLAGLRDRVEALGGSVELSSVRGVGTSVVARLPRTSR